MEQRLNVTLERNGRRAVIVMRFDDYHTSKHGDRMKWGSGPMWTIVDAQWVEDVVFDYANQAWIRNGRYERCGHPESMDCRCYGKEHEGEMA